MQTILGSGGAIGIHLARVLPKYTDKVRLVSRHPEKSNDRDELFAANLLNAEEVKHAVENSKIVYLMAGLAYDHKVWERDWLVFFDNIYMYTPDLPVPMTERTKVAPATKKGKVRAGIAEKLMQANKDGLIKALIARSADFYGPGAAKNSVLDQTIIQNIISGKTANWLGNPDKKHSFTYTPDAAVGTALLGNTPDAYGQVWHLPTHDEPPTGREWAEMTGKLSGKEGKIRATPKWLMSVLGIFMPVMRELKEMSYQYEQDYVFDSTKFEDQFMMKATPYKIGLEHVLKKDYPGSMV